MHALKKFHNYAIGAFLKTYIGLIKYMRRYSFLAPGSLKLHSTSCVPAQDIFVSYDLWTSVLHPLFFSATWSSSNQSSQHLTAASCPSSLTEASRRSSPDEGIAIFASPKKVSHVLFWLLVKKGQIKLCTIQIVIQG